MAKYSEQLKLNLVKQYLAGASGTRILAQRHGVGRSVLRRWIAAYEQHGRDGLRKKHSHYDARFKMSVLKHMRKKELSYQQVAAVFDIRSPGCIGKWERQYHDGGIDALTPRPRGRPKTMIRPVAENPTEEKNAPDERTREQLLKENEYLRAEVAYLKKLDALLQAKKQAQPKKRRK